jgi:serine/threonine-protein kinase ATR
MTGLETSEFILPLLIADRICYGTHEEFACILKEFLDILDFELDDTTQMDSGGRQKAVNAFFHVADTLSYWAEQETELRCKSSRSSSSSSRSKRKELDVITTESAWAADETMTQIREFLGKIPLLLQAKAASNVGMHARALQLLEKAARKEITITYFESTSEEILPEVQGSLLQPALLKNLDSKLMKTVLSNLNECETMSVLDQDPFLSSPLLEFNDKILWNEASGNYDEALRDYERALQIKDAVGDINDTSLERGALNCYLELGKYETVLSMVQSKEEKQCSVKPFAVEASWRLGHWDTLSRLVENTCSSTEGLPFPDKYRESIGRAISCIKKLDTPGFEDSLRVARGAVMGSLATVAREGYSKSYPDILRLHCIREIEDAAQLLLCRESKVDTISIGEMSESIQLEGWSWDGRLNLASPLTSSPITDVRLAVARLGRDPVMEGSLLLHIGKRARKNGMHSLSDKYLTKAEATISSVAMNGSSPIQKLDILIDDVRVQYAKLMKQTGEHTRALRILGYESNENPFDGSSSAALEQEKKRIESIFGTEAANSANDEALANRVARRILRLTEWTVDGGMHHKDIMKRFRLVIDLSPKWEKGKFEGWIYLLKMKLCFTDFIVMHQAIFISLST